ncbi:MAG: hypothetical protein AABX02_02855 [archaeon]
MHLLRVHFHSRGQMALDLLFALLILLIVLSALAPVLNRFEESHAEISLHQQLRENGMSSQFLLSSSASYFREPISYPGNPNVVTITNTTVRAPGGILLSTLRALKSPQGFSCISEYDPSTHSYLLTVPSSATQLPADVTYSFSFFEPADYHDAHTFSFNDCYGPFSIGVVP